MNKTIGLCEECVHHSVITSQRNAAFHLCNKSKNDTAFPKYPKLPVRECAGFKKVTLKK